MGWVIEPLPHLRGYTVEWAEPNNYFLSRRNEIFHSDSLTPPFRPIAVIGAPRWKNVASRLRLPQRLLRFLVTNVIPLVDGSLFVTFDKTAGIVRDGKYHSLSGMMRPCRVLRSACAVDESGAIFFGEYLANTDRGEMLIYKYKGTGDELEVAYTFPPGSIRHIHGLYYDRFSKSILCLTGDDEKECQILQTGDGFKNTTTVGCGDETWRAVSALFTEDKIVYGMDAEYRTNHIFSLDRTTGDRVSLGEVNGTVFYSKKLGEDLFFTTTAENAPSQTENVAALWHVNSEGACKRLISFEKDRWHPSLFMFGTIHFPYFNASIDELYFHVVAVNGDNQSFRARRN